MKAIRLPRAILVGEGVVKNVIAFVEDYRKRWVVSGPHTAEILGRKLASQIDAELVISEDYVVPRRIRDGVVVAVGGGRIIDLAKVIALRRNVDYISVPTNSAHDGIASSVVSWRWGVSRPAKPPLAVIADTHVIAKAPFRFVAAGVGDVIAKFTAVRDWQLGHILKGEYYGDYAASLSLLAAKLVSRRISEIANRTERGLRVLLEALISCGTAMAIAGSTRPGSGAEHKIAHSLDALGAEGLHGEKCGIGTIIAAYLQGQDWQAIRHTLERVGCPVNAEGLNVKSDVLIRAIVRARRYRSDRYTILDHMRVDRRMAEKVARATEVI